MAQHILTTWENVPQESRNRFRRRRKWYILQGILYVAAGTLAIILPLATALAVEILLGALLFVGGISKAVTSIGKQESGWYWASALLAILTGGLMLWNPWAGLVALSALVAVFLVLEGVLEIFYAFRFKPLPGWAWLLSSGIISLLLGLAAFVLFPLIGMLYIGIILGISLLLYGAALLILLGRLEHALTPDYSRE